MNDYFTYLNVAEHITDNMNRRSNKTNPKCCAEVKEYCSCFLLEPSFTHVKYWHQTQPEMFKNNYI